MGYTVQLVYAIPGGQKPRTYSIQVTWTDSTDPNAASVNVYRATVSGGPYTKIASGIAMGVQTYNDVGLVPFRIYYYVTTEVDNNSNESAFSAETSASAGVL